MPLQRSRRTLPDRPDLPCAQRALARHPTGGPGRATLFYSEGYSGTPHGSRPGAVGGRNVAPPHRVLVLGPGMAGASNELMVREARYDAVADWYTSWVGDGDGLIADGVGNLVPPAVHGARVLDVACGHGRASRAVARLGAHVTGVDLSAELVARARAQEATDPLGIRYYVADVADLDHWWDGTAFDGAVCEMAMMDIDDLHGTVSAVATTLCADGWFVISMVHPCFPGNEAGLSNWPPERSYFDEGWWTSPEHNPAGVRIRVGSSHRTVSTYLNALIDAGFSLDRVVEPPAPVPTFLLLRSRRSATTA